MYHQESPGGVVEEDGRREDEHCEADDAIELGVISMTCSSIESRTLTRLLAAIIVVFCSKECV